MLKNFLKLSAVLTGVLGFAGAANATISATGSVGGAAIGVNFVNFNTDTSTATTAQACPLASPALSVGISFAGGAHYQTGAVSQLAAPPDLSGGNGTNFGFTSPIGASCGLQANGVDATQYIVAPSGGSITITLPALEKYLGLLWGSIDSFNTLTFKQGGTTVGTFSGTQILAGANGDQGVNGTLYVNFTSDNNATAFDSVVLTSGGNSFEADDLAFNQIVPNRIPEPMTLGLFGAGLAGLGFVRRKAKKT